jgi:peptidyl-prolyl cis-trans isomerase C
MAQQSSQPANTTQEVLAIVNGQKITRLDFEQLVQQYRPDNQEWTERNKGQVLRDLITLELLSQEGFKLRLEQEPAVQSQIRFRTKDVVARSLVQRYIAERVQVTDEAIQKHYEVSKDHYKVEEQITASHILVRTESEAQTILKELKQGKDFAAIARARSIDTSAAEGGSLGTFGRGEMIPAFENIAFTLRVGETSSPVHTEFGYHIIKVTNRIAPQIKPLEEVRDDIRDVLIEQAVDTYINELRRNATVEVLRPEYALDESQAEKKKEK